MKKLYLIGLFCLMSLAAACTGPSLQEPPITISHLDIFYLNDLHGQMLPDESRMGLAAIGNLLMTRRAVFPDHTLILAGGDMLHGSALSNIDKGRPIVELMARIGFDALVLGNHEFDWGLPAVTRYFGAEGTDPIADFALLGANVFETARQGLPEAVEPYAIFTRGQLRIGVIGTIGYGLERSIATRYVEGYAFLDPAPIVEDLARHLRTIENCDIVLLLTHDSGGVNHAVMQFDEDARIDAIFNAHSHQVFAYTEYGVPVIQSGGYGHYVGHLRFDLDQRSIVGVHLEQLTRANEPLLNYPQPDIAAAIESFRLASYDWLETPIIYNPDTVDRDALTQWMSRLIRSATSADLGLHNTGGTRMPFSGDTILTMNDLYDVFPFDNTIKTVWLTGLEITQFLERYQWRNHDTLIDVFEPEKLYKVAANDFIFNQPHYPFIHGFNPINTMIQQRDLALHELQKQALLYGSFSVNRTILTDDLDVLYPSEEARP